MKPLVKTDRSADIVSTARIQILKVQHVTSCHVFLIDWPILSLSLGKTTLSSKSKVSPGQYKANLGAEDGGSCNQYTNRTPSAPSLPDLKLLSALKYTNVKK